MEHPDMEYAGTAIFIGAVATLVTDFWAMLRKRLFGVSAPDWRLVGRWLAQLTRGRFRHESMTTVPPVRGERWIGWIAHYVIGIVFAAALLAVCGITWARQPTIGPALAVGIITVAAPFLLMQPGMGAGIAARRTARPNAARLQSLITHAIFGVGLYVAEVFLRLLSGG